MKRLVWPVFAGALFTAWGLLGWTAANDQPAKTETQLAPAVVCEIRP